MCVYDEWVNETLQVDFICKSNLFISWQLRKMHHNKLIIVLQAWQQLYNTI